MPVKKQDMKKSHATIIWWPYTYSFWLIERKHLKFWTGQIIETLLGTIPSNVDSSIEWCKNECAAKKFKYAGIQIVLNRNECFCGNSYGKYGGARADECMGRCNDKTKQKVGCGGFRRNNIYRINVLDFLKCGAKIPAPRPKPTGWEKIVSDLQFVSIFIYSAVICTSDALKRPADHEETDGF